MCLDVVFIKREPRCYDGRPSVVVDMTLDRQFEVAESFFNPLKRECMRRHIYKTRE